MIELWMEKDLMLSFDSVILLCLYFFIWKIRQTILVYKDAAGMWNIDNKKPYVEIIVNLTLNIILVNWIGINGVIISTIVSMFFISLIWETRVFFKEYFKESTIAYYKKLIIYIFITFLGCILTYFICDFIKIGGITGFILKIVICVFVPNIAIISLNWKNENFRYVLKLLKRN